MSVWSDIAAATKLTSVSLFRIQTASQQADVVSALTALPEIQQLTWRNILCSDEQDLSDSSLLQHLTKLTALHLLNGTAEALQHLGSLTKLQHLEINIPQDWDAAGCPGLQELQALTRLELYHVGEVPSSISQLTALQQLELGGGTPTSLNRLHALTGLTRLWLRMLSDLTPHSPPLQLTGLQHLTLKSGLSVAAMPVSFLARCLQLRVLELVHCGLWGPGSLAANPLLQHLEIRRCHTTTADGPGTWQQVFPGPGQLPHLTSLRAMQLRTTLTASDIQAVVACCSSLQVLQCDTFPDSAVCALAPLSGLTSLYLRHVDDELCCSLAQLTGLRELRVGCPEEGLSAVGLQSLTALEQLTSLGFWDGPRRTSFSPVPWEEFSDTLPGWLHAIVNQVCVTRAVGVGMCKGGRACCWTIIRCLCFLSGVDTTMP